MATTDGQITPGTGFRVAAYSFTEDTFTRNLQRTALNLNTGVEWTYGPGEAAASSPRVVLASGSGLETTITFTPSVVTGAQTALDVIFDTEALANVGLANGAQVILESIHVSDGDDQGIGIDLYFFNANTSLGTEGSVPNIADAGALTMVAGPISILASDWKDLGLNRVASIHNLGVRMKLGAATTSLWVAGQTIGAPTYTSSGLQFQFTFRRV